MNRHRSFLLFACLFAMNAYTQSVLHIQTDKPVARIEPTMWGIFFEDINFAADGGIYAELVKNRSFEFAHPMMGWRERNGNKYAIKSNAGTVQILNEARPGNPRIARVTALADKGYGIVNDGFRGMGVKENASYTFSVLARQQQGNTILRVELIDTAGKVLGTASVQPSGKQWKKYTASFKATSTNARAKLAVWFDGKGVTDIDMVSLFPEDTWKNRPGGLRKDLVQLLADMKPGFVRFPGGCIVEGRDLDNRYQWKKTIGDINNRELIINRWNTEFNHRLVPDYFQSFGLGFYEYFLLSEDIGAEPLPILNCGMACQFNTSELVPLEQLDPYLQDALDLIEFANGSITTKWGKLRKEMGHPAPFNLKYLGIGNEQWGPQYFERYKIFAKAIKAKYPGIQLVTGTGPSPNGELFDYASQELKELKADIVDEHYYSSPDWFLKNATRYDNYDRNGPKIFAGEYAAQSDRGASPDNKNNWLTALSEAAFMTGLERNADIVTMASYAPLLAHVDAWQWKPDMIWFDNLGSFGTPNYYVQKLFSLNKGTHVLPVNWQGEKKAQQDSIYASAVRDQVEKNIIVKLVNADHKPKEIELRFEGAANLQQEGTLTVLQGNDGDVNSIEQPRNIYPQQIKQVQPQGRSVKVSLAPKSLSVLKLPLQ